VRWAYSISPGSGQPAKQPGDRTERPPPREATRQTSSVRWRVGQARSGW
jgi:hypothetical protein